MMRLYSVGSTMFPTERAVTCQLLATADSMMAWRMAKPAGAEEEEGELRVNLYLAIKKSSKVRIVWLSAMVYSTVKSF